MRIFEYSIEEKLNIGNAREAFSQRKGLLSHTSLVDLDLFKHLDNLIFHRLKDEEIMISEIEKQIDSLSTYYRDLSNLKLSSSNISLQNSSLNLQKQLNWSTTKLAIALGASTAFVEILIALFIK